MLQYPIIKDTMYQTLAHEYGVQRKMSSAEQQEQVNWQEWMQRWDDQQKGYLPLREARFATMLDVLDLTMPPTMRVLDLACGPGSISQRILARFPQARCVALDWDPVLLRLGQETLGDYNGRLHWVEADLQSPTWTALLELTLFDAVLSTTALHWLPIEHLVRTYKHLGQMVREGGIVLNGDNIAFAPHLTSFHNIADTITKRTYTDAFVTRGVEDWERWWHGIAAVPGIGPLIAERERRFSNRPHEPHPIYDVHIAALSDAGFREVGTIWQHFDDRVVMAVR